MTQNTRRIVVIGGGPAAHRFVEAMSSRGAVAGGAFAITVLTEECHLPYDRVALSKALTDPGVDLTLGAKSLWEQDGITLVTGARAVDIDLGSREVITDAGARFGYDELVLATGSNAATLPIPGHEHTSVYRTLEDVWSINRKVAELTATLGRTVNAVTIGGGLLGLEAAAGLQTLGANPVVIDGGKWLMGTQLDEGAGQAMGRLIADKGLQVHGGVYPAAVLTAPGADGEPLVTGVEMADGRIIDADMVVVSIGVRPRDEIARTLNARAKAEAAAAAGVDVSELGDEDFVPVFRMGARGGIVIDETCATDVGHIWAIGEVANFGGLCVGLVAPANTMAEIVADRLHGGDATFPGFDTATKLKLSGVDVASFGDAFAATPGALEIVYADPARGVYQKLVVTDDARTLLGGIFVGDAAPYTSLRPLLGRELPAEPGAYLSAAGAGEVPDTELPDDAVLCSCNNIAAGSIRDAVNGCGSCQGNEPVRELGGLKSCTRAGTQCGSCVPMLKKLLEQELAKSGIAVSKALCEHFAMSRAELFEAVRALELTSAEEILARFGTPVEVLPGERSAEGTSATAPLGCDICKPVIGSILASQHSSYVLDGGRGVLQDTNDRALANMQKNGTYSVVPRIPGGEITPEKLGVIARVAEKYGLYTKITGALRIDMFGARLEQLPEIWKELVEAGFESGHAYGKALRNVKSCVGSTWCRYGVQDSVSMAINLELRYRGLRSPHKLKIGVSGCARECAEARGKDVGVIATADGWNMYVGGNGGATPAHAQLLAKDLDDQTLVKYIDRYLMYYIRTADRLQRTARWVEELDGGIDHVRDVVVHDSLGIAEDLEAAMARHVDSYEDEWAATLKDPERLRRFRSFVNAPQEADDSILTVTERGMIRPATEAEIAAGAGSGPVLLGTSIPVRPAR